MVLTIPLLVIVSYHLKYITLFENIHYALNEHTKGVQVLSVFRIVSKN